MKYFIILIVGIIETYFSTNWTLYATDRKPILSSIMMFLFLTINLLIVSWAIKGNDTLNMILVYSLSASLGNYLSVKLDLKKRKWDENKYLSNI